MLEKASGDREKLRVLAHALPEEDLKDAFDYYMSLASFVMTEELDEDPALDLANWIVAQGKGFYFDIYNHHYQPPPGAPTGHGAGFLGTLGRVYWDGFGRELT